MKMVSFVILFLVFSLTGLSTTFTISTSGFAFTPASTTINLGDIVNFALAGTNHDAVEVSLATYNANGSTPLSGGFSFGIGISGTIPAAKLTVGTHYFVCTPHIGFGMKGTIIVNNSNCTPPSAPAMITGNTVVCTSSLNSYSIAAVPGATDYTWTLPSGWTGSSSTNTINATSGTSGGSIKVTANSACGNSSPTTLNVSITGVPQKPGVISGPNAICINSTNLYSISAFLGATSYSWTLPSGWTGTSNSNAITTQANSNSGNILVTANNECGASVSQSISISVSGPPNQPGIISGNNAVCNGSANVYSVTAVPGATSYTWSLPVGWNGSSATNSITVTAGTGGGTLSVVANGICGASVSRALAVSVSSGPGQPSGISGNSTICANSINTYSVPLVAGATAYTWTLPGGWTGTSTTNSINVTSSSVGGNISVTANNSCGNSSPQNLAIIVNSPPAQPGVISGNLSVCANSSNTYSVTAVPGATSYSWTLPGGWTGSSNSTSISVNAGPNGGDIKVSANNTCGTSTVSTLSVITLAPQAPAPITGKSAICGNSSNVYSVPEVSGATSYTWVLPPGWTGTSTSNNITAIAGSSGGNITVSANNTCGSSSVQTLGVSVGNVPALPGVISGLNNICGNSTNQYAISLVPGATSYTWSLPNGWSGSSNTNTISAIAGLSGGDITVLASNTCGSSGKQIFPAVIINPPAQPGMISGNATPCSKSTNSYTVAEVSGASSYTWTLPDGWAGASTTNNILVLAGSTGGNVTVSAKNSCGISSLQTLAINLNKAPEAPASITGNASVCAGSSNTYTATSVNGALSYTWVLPNGWSGASATNSINTIAGVAGGTINVVANNTCGQSTPVTFNVSTIAPPSPAVISGNNNVCINSNNTYTVQAVTGATSYTWNLPGDWTGTSSTNSITALTGATSGNISVTANNTCGASLPQTLAVIVKQVPAIPSIISGLSLTCPNSITTYIVGSAADANSYTWTLPNGWTGTSTTNSIIATAGTLGGILSIVANNTCGSSTPLNMAITIIAPPGQPTAINGIGSVCANSQNDYSINSVPGATTYSWSLPPGWSGVSTNNTITAVAGLKSGTISVTANNSCGSSTPATLSATITTIPAIPLNIAGDTSVCPHSELLYTVPEVPGATYYSWIFPTGWTVNSVSNTITTITSTTGGNVMVTANNACGASPKQTLTVSIKQINKAIDQTNHILTAKAMNAGYQWIDCDTKTPLANQTNQTFTATLPGNYAVVIRQNDCIDTSVCMSILTVADQDNASSIKLDIYPNPSEGLIHIDSKSFTPEWIVISNALGQSVQRINDPKRTEWMDLSGYGKGMYIATMKIKQNLVVRKISIQ